MVVGATGPRSALHLDSRSTGGVAATRPRRCPLNRRVALQPLKLRSGGRGHVCVGRGERPRRRCVSCAAPAKLRVRAGGRGLRGGRSWAGRRGYAEQEGGCAEGVRLGGGATRSGRAAARRGCAEGLRGGRSRRVNPNPLIPSPPRRRAGRARPMCRPASSQ